ELLHAFTDGYLAEFARQQHLRYAGVFEPQRVAALLGAERNDQRRNAEIESFHQSVGTTVAHEDIELRKKLQVWNDRCEKHLLVDFWRRVEMPGRHDKPPRRGGKSIDDGFQDELRAAEGKSQSDVDNRIVGSIQELSQSGHFVAGPPVREEWADKSNVGIDRFG